MKLSDLKTGYVVTLRNGDHMMVLRDFYDSHGSIKNVFFDIIKNEWDNFEAYNEDMKCIHDSLCDVMKVITIPSPVEHNFKYGKRVVLWEREEQIDWSKLKENAIVYAKASPSWLPRHFAKFENEKVYIYPNNSFRTCIDSLTIPSECKLSEKTKASEWDWSKVDFNHIIYVKNKEEEYWVKKYYTGYVDDKVITNDGKKYPYAKIIKEVQA